MTETRVLNIRLGPTLSLRVHENILYLFLLKNVFDNKLVRYQRKSVYPKNKLSLMERWRWEFKWKPHRWKCLYVEATWLLNPYIIIRRPLKCDSRHTPRKTDRAIYQFDVVCTVHHPTICVWTNKIHTILVIRLYFLLDALHVSDYSQQQPDISAYTKFDVQLIKVAPEDGLIQSETCRASNGK